MIQSRASFYPVQRPTSCYIVENEDPLAASSQQERRELRYALNAVLTK